MSPLDPKPLWEGGQVRIEPRSHVGVSPVGCGCGCGLKRDDDIDIHMYVSE